MFENVQHKMIIDLRNCESGCHLRVYESEREKMNDKILKMKGRDGMMGKEINMDLVDTLGPGSSVPLYLSPIKGLVWKSENKKRLSPLTRH